MKYVYVLRLTNNKFFVSSTYNLYPTLKDMFSKHDKKHNWLLLYHPLYVDSIIADCNDNDEYEYLIKYIRNHGVDNVRGRLFDSSIHASESIREIMEKINKDNKHF